MSENHAMKRALIFDADDTLWESNIYFLDATEAFLDVMESHRMDRQHAMDHLTSVEERVIAEHGYGTRGFIQSLSQTATSLLPEISSEALSRIEHLGHAIMARDTMTLRPGVAESIRHLAGHDRLLLLTKGDDDEQRAKLTRSGLEPYFEHVLVAREKDAETYRALVIDQQLDPAWTWMIGNSPRSDINPALEAGLNAVLIPHPHTWEMEMEDLMESHEGRLRIVESVSDLIQLFVQTS